MQVITQNENTNGDTEDIEIIVADGGLGMETEACTRIGSSVPIFLGGEYLVYCFKALKL